MALDGVRALSATDADQPRKRGHLFLAGSVTFENVIGEPVAVSDLLEFAREDEVGRAAVRAFHGDQRALDGGGEVGSSEKVGGEILYEIPSDARGLRLGCDPAGGGSYAWLLGDAAQFFGSIASAPTKGPGKTEADMVQAVEDHYRAVDREDWAYTYVRRRLPGAAGRARGRDADVHSLVARGGGHGLQDVRRRSLRAARHHLRLRKRRMETPLLRGVSSSQGAAVKVGICGHYGAIDRGEFGTAYSYFGPTHRKLEGRRAWISSERTYGMTAETINYLDVTYADGIATATVDVTFQDATGAPRFLVTWILTRQDGVWKLDRQTSSERLQQARPKLPCARMRPPPFALESGHMTGGKKNRAVVLTEVSLVLAALFWGGNYAATKYATDFFPPLLFVTLRFSLAAVLLLAAMRIFEPGSRLKRGDVLPMALLGCFGVGAAQTCFTFGLSLTTAANTGLVFATAPVWGMLLAAALGLERPGWGGLIGVALSIAGVAVVVRGGLGAEGASLLGDGLILLAAVCVGAYTVLSMPLLERHSPLAVATYPTLFAVPAVLLASTSVLPAVEWGEVGIGAWAALAYAGALATAFAFAAWQRGISRIGANRVLVYQYLITLAGVSSGVVFLGESLGVDKVLGGAVILLGVYLARR